MPDYSCDALIIGSGQAGNPLATALAEAGRTYGRLVEHRAQTLLPGHGPALLR